MVEYNLDDRSHAPVIARAAAAGVGVVVKKGLGSGRLPAGDAIGFVLANPGVVSMVVGTLDLAHLRENVAAASALPAAQTERM
jgi:aryl-alcohol dehydrogenase-like predicted oxidoreductase